MTEIYLVENSASFKLFFDDFNNLITKKIQNLMERGILMPSWSIHLAIAKEVNKVLNLDADLFYYGNLIPDVDRGTLISRDDAHYYNKNLAFPNCPKEYMIDLEAFLNDYKEQLTNPLILGYYCHLLVDTFYDNEIYSKKWV